MECLSTSAPGIVGHAPAAPVRQATYSFEEGLLTPLQAMALLGYDNQDAFMRMVRRAGIPRVLLNKRVIRFDRRSLNEWIRRRSIRCA